MKRSNKLMLGIAGLMLVLLFNSCKKDEDSPIGPLSIERITTVTDRVKPITTAELSSFVLVHGTGFVGVEKILINDIELDLDETYITPDMISLKVPRKLPVEINNQLTVITHAGKVESKLSVEIPPLKIIGMVNEFALPGAEMTVVGDFFDLYEIDSIAGKVLVGDVELPLKSSSWTSVKFKLPSDVPAGTVISLKSPRITSKVPGRYRFEGLMLYDAVSNLGWGGGNGRGTIIKDNVPYEPINGPYIRIRAAADSYSWGEAIAINGINITQDIIDNPQNYILKYEMNTVIPIKKRWLFFSLSGNEWHDEKSVDTNKEWKTFSLNLSTIVKDNQLPLNNVMVQVWSKQWLDSGEIGEEMDLCLDNIRIVPVE